MSTSIDRLDSLDSLVEKGRQYFEPRINAKAKAHAIERALLISLFAIGCIFVVNLLALFSVILFGLSNYLMVGCCVFAAAVIFIGTYYSYKRNYAVDRKNILAYFDQQLSLNDGLQTLDEFLAIEHPSVFQRAAIVKCQGYIKQAFAAQLTQVPNSFPIVSESAKRYIKLLIILVIGWGIISAIDVAGYLKSKQVAEKRPSEAVVEIVKQGQLPKQKHELNENKNGHDDNLSEGKAKQQSDQLSQLASKSKLSNVEQGAISKSTSNSANNLFEEEQIHQSENQAQAIDQMMKSSSESKASKAGNSPSSPSATSSVASATADQDDSDSANRASGDNNEDNSEDSPEDVQESIEKQQTTSSMSMERAERKAPVNRRMSPGASSNQENKDANGIGGASGLKKTRGVAAMMLGVPLPDRLEGMTSPGGIKSSIQVAPPKEKEFVLAESQSRQAKNTSQESVQPELYPAWMRHLLSNYFNKSQK